jgi:predicted PurR-regulated permease PerM
MGRQTQADAPEGAGASARSDAAAVVLAAFGLVVAWLLARQVFALLLALLLAVILALPLAAVADRLQARRVPRVVSVIGTVALVVALLVALGMLVIPRIVDEAQAFALALPAVLADVGRWLRTTFGVQTGDLGAELRDAVPAVVATPARCSPPARPARRCWPGCSSSSSARSTWPSRRAR